jgi:hypothetical protein
MVLGMYKVLIGALLVLGFVAYNEGVKSALGIVLLFGLIGAIGTLFYNTEHLDPETRRYRALAILGIIFFLWWAQSQIS